MVIKQTNNDLYSKIANEKIMSKELNNDKIKLDSIYEIKNDIVKI